ncbi:uncharacterized protein isoform X1 [Leptinotarsa decemlineata]|uniref:uncharacterized protein isoform X1 n=1 Tax=Leptinotarsa decemlineata TaxID=7539 RepID=UPI003D30C0E0
MDIDSTSNCSAASNLTKERNSTVSGFSEYLSELGELQYLRSPQNYSLTNNLLFETSKNDSGCDIHCEEYIDDLSHQLQGALKVDLQFENENIRLNHHSKFEALLKTNGELRSKLTRANEQIDRLLNKYCRRENFKLDTFFLQLEQNNYDLKLQNSILERKLLQAEAEKTEAELQLKKLYIDKNQNKTIVDMKSAVIEELKEKISTQHVEIIRLTKNMCSSSQLINEVNVELEHTRCALEWHKNELNSLQANKKRLLDELSDCRKEMFLQKESISNLNLELHNIKNNYESLQLKALTDKVDFYKSQKFQHPVTHENRQQKTTEVQNEDPLILKEYESNIQDLKNEISRINAFVKIQTETMEKANRENSDLVSCCIKLQKLLEQKENIIDSLEIEIKSAKMEIETFASREQQALKNRNELKKELINSKTELVRSKQENEIIISTVKAIRDQVYTFKMKHDSLSKELADKNKQISSLQSEKQDLFMRNSWQICELEKINDRDLLISSLRKEIQLKEQEIQTYSRKIAALEDAIEKQGISLSKLIDDKDMIISENGKEIQRYENVVLQYKDLLLCSEKKVYDLEKRQQGQVNSDSGREVSRETKRAYPSSLIECCENLDDDLKTLMKINSPEIPENEKVVEETIDSCAACNERQKVVVKIRSVVERVEKLGEKVEECQKLLSEVSAIQSKVMLGSNAVEQLKVLLQVKNLQLQERQRKYEKNNRTLLRKVNELMQARGLSEKINKKLQERFDVLKAENKSLRLTIESHISEYEKLKQSTVELEARLEYCSACHNNSPDNKGTLDCPGNIESMISSESQLQEIIKNENICNKQKEVCIETFHEIEEPLRDMVSSGVDNSKNESIDLKSHNSKKIFENIHLGNELMDKMESVSNDNKVVRLFLQNKTENNKCLQEDLSKTQTSKCTKNSDDFVNELKNHIDEIQNELDVTNREKFFLQRICNDLKLSLRSQSNYSKILEEKLNRLSERKNDYSSLPNICPGLPSSKMYDDRYIKELLQNKEPVQDIHLAEMRNCLDSLRREILTLQDEVMQNCSI